MPPVEIPLDWKNGHMTWAAALSVGRPPLPWVPRIARAATINSQAYSHSPSTSLIVPFLTFSLTSGSHSASVRKFMYCGEKFGVTNDPDISE